jgi:hypothetical protein
VSATCRPAGVAALAFSVPQRGKVFGFLVHLGDEVDLALFRKRPDVHRWGSEETVAGWLMAHEEFVVLRKVKDHPG